MTNKKVQKKIKVIASFSVLINILLFSLKIWVGLISNSISIIADAWHTLSDSITSIILPNDLVLFRFDLTMNIVAMIFLGQFRLISIYLPNRLIVS